MSTVQEIERAIGNFSPQELAELYSWLDEHHPQPIDASLATDLEAGLFDGAILRALEDYENGRAQPL